MNSAAMRWPKTSLIPLRDSGRLTRVQRFIAGARDPARSLLIGRLKYSASCHRLQPSGNAEFGKSFCERGDTHNLA
jgi:hypothetical protein